MSRRGLRRLALVCLLALLLCGCERLYIDTYISVTDHEEMQPDAGSDEYSYEVHTYSGIRSALLELIASGASEGLIRAQDYAGSLQDDISRACLDVTRETPIGAYAVEYITHTVSRILSAYEIRLHISYRIGQEELNSVQSVLSAQELYRLMDSALTAGKGKLAAQIATLSVSAQTLTGYAENFYRQNPDRLSAKPSVSVSFYPSEEHVSKIIELSFVYPLTPDEEATRLAQLSEAADAVLSGISPQNEADTVLQCCRALADRAAAQSSGSTAYDALALHGADSEGFAMALQLLCSRLGIECQVVEGKMDGDTHFWNIVKLGQKYGHVDPFACAAGAAAGIAGDEELIGVYWWDVERYPQCAVSSAAVQREENGIVPMPEEQTFEESESAPETP